MFLWWCCLSVPIWGVCGTVPVSLPLSAQWNWAFPSTSLGSSACFLLLPKSIHEHFLLLTQIHLMDFLMTRFPETSRATLTPANVNVPFLSLNDLEIDTVLFYFFLLIRFQSVHRSLNVLLYCSIFLLCCWNDTEIAWFSRNYEILVGNECSGVL